MKNLLIFVLAGVSVLSHAQDTEQKSGPLPRAIVKISPFQFFSQTLELSVECLNREYSRGFEFNGALRSGHYDYEQGRGFTIGTAYRKYVRFLATPTRRNPEAAQGIYYNLFLKGHYFVGRGAYYWQSPSSEPIEERTTTINPGFTLGLQRTLFEVMFLDIFVGGGIKFTNTSYSDEIPNFTFMDYDLLHPAYEGIHPVAGIKLGVGL